MDAKASSNITIRKTVATAGTAGYSKADAVNLPLPIHKRKPPSDPPAPDSGSKMV